MGYRNGTKIWRAGFHVENAVAINLIFQPYRLNKGVRIFLYDPEQQTVLGAFTDHNNKQGGIMATAHIPGETLIVEMQVPRYVDAAGPFTIARAGCDFSYPATGMLLKDGWYGLSGECNADIACYDDTSWQVMKNAVVRIVYLGGERCTGTLVNNTQQDGRNYVLTAEHCISSEAVANMAVFYFDYESPVCNGPDGSNHKSISGATMRATGDKLDFSLLELLERSFAYIPIMQDGTGTFQPRLYHSSPQGDGQISVESLHRSRKFRQYLRE
jgi:hypothetical protein